MKGETFQIKLEYYASASAIIEHLLPNIRQQLKYVICIAGESGSGKSVTAITLGHELDQKDITNTILHMDDYFILPPKSNHENRLLSFENVGLHEVDLAKLQSNIDDFKLDKQVIIKPLVDYHANSIETEKVNLSATKVLIVEGTYVGGLRDCDTLIFMERTYKDTYENRKERNREAESAFIENVLELEHKIISAFRPKSDILVDKSYRPIFRK